MKTRPILIAGIIIVIVFFAYATLLLVASWPIQDWSIHNASLFGDSFGALNSLFTAGAFLLILWTIVLQQAELRLQRQEMSRMVAAHERELQMELLSYALNDDDLAKVWSDEIKDMTEFKQDKYVHLIAYQWCVGLRKGTISREIVNVELRGLMKKSKHFRRYWSRRTGNWIQLATIAPEYREFYELCEDAYQASLVNQESQKSAL